MKLLPMTMAVGCGIPVEGFDAGGPLGLIWFSRDHGRWFAVKVGYSDPSARIEPTGWVPPTYVETPESRASRLLEFIMEHRRGSRR